MKNNITPELTFKFLLNSQDICNSLPPTSGEDNVAEIGDKLHALSSDEAAQLMPVLVELLVEEKPELLKMLKQLEDKEDTRDLTEVAQVAAGLWEVAKQDIEYIAIIVVFLRALGENKLKTQFFKYEGKSVYKELRKLLGWK